MNTIDILIRTHQDTLNRLTLEHQKLLVELAEKEKEIQKANGVLQGLAQAMDALDAKHNS